MVGWHHQLSGHDFWWTLAVGNGQAGLVCCSSWGHKELDMTEQLNNSHKRNWNTPTLLVDTQTGTLPHFWWTHNMVQQLWKTIWHLLKKLNMESP